MARAQKPFLGDKGVSNNGRRLRVTAAAKGSAKVKSKKKAAAPSVPEDGTNVSVVENPESNSRARLTVTVPQTLCRKTWDNTLGEISKTSQVDGFRKGDRIPEFLLVRMMGETEVKKQVLEQLLKSTLGPALDAVAGRALKESEHIAQSAQDLVAVFSPDAPFQYDITVDVIPEIKWTQERAYANLEVEVEIEDKANEAAAVEARIRSRRKDFGTLRVSQSSGLKVGDVAVVDISAFRVLEDGNAGDPIFSATQKGFQLDSEESFQNLLPGFVDAIVGLERSQTRVFDLPFPGTWQQESLRGVTGRFEVLCQELFERELPPEDDELAAKIIPGAATMAEVREVVARQWRDEWAQKKRQATMLALLDALVKVCEMEVPNSLLEEQGRQMYGAKLIELQAGGRLSRADAERLMTEEMVGNYLRSQRETITRQVKQALAVQEVFRLEGLSFSEEELEVETASAVAEFKAYNQEYDEGRVREQAAELLEGSKVLEFLTENATVTYTRR